MILCLLFECIELYYPRIVGSGVKHLVGQTNCNRFTTEVKKEEWTHLQSPELKRVDLTVSTHKFKHYKMFGTLTEKKDGDYQDPCSGDSGGPLMYQMKNSRRWVIIGQLW